MIRLTRDLTKLHANFFGNKKHELEEELLQITRDIRRQIVEKHNFTGKSSRWKAGKPELIEDSKGKCAYCESNVTVNAYVDVEHYRPKSIYWWLAYSYDNYLASCRLCNAKYKSDHFPVKNSRMKIPVNIRKNTSDEYITEYAGTLAPDPRDNQQVSNFNQLHNAERPTLLNPYVDEPTEYFAWQVDHVDGEVELVPIDQNAAEYVEAAVAFYGLNREKLKIFRYEVYENYQLHDETRKEPSISQSLRNRINAKINKMQMNKAVFAGMVRYFDS